MMMSLLAYLCVVWGVAVLLAHCAFRSLDSAAAAAASAHAAVDRAHADIHYENEHGYHGRNARTTGRAPAMAYTYSRMNNCVLAMGTSLVQASSCKFPSMTCRILPSY